MKQSNEIKGGCAYGGSFRRDNAGVTSIEYALVAALIALVVVVAVAAAGTGLDTFFRAVAGCVSEAAQGRAC